MVYLYLMTTKKTATDPTKSTTGRKPKSTEPAKFKLVRVKSTPQRHRTGKTVSIMSPVCPLPVVDADGNINIAKLSRTKLARAVKVDLAHISRIFSGKRSPSLDLARRIADYMGVSLDKLQAFLDGRQP